MNNMERPTALCINLDSQPEKYNDVLKEFEDILDIKRVSAIDAIKENISGKDALYRTTTNIINSLFTENNYSYPYLIIIEDDIYKYKNFKLYWPKILEFINTTQTGWDFISLDFFLNLENAPLEIYNDFLYKADKSRNKGFMIYNSEFIKREKEYLTDCGCADMMMCRNTNFVKLIPKELIVKQFTNKVSATCGLITSHYEAFYNETEQYLKEYPF
jgi:hypothetical protein